MTGLTDFAQWYDLIYLLPGGVALVVLLLSTLGGGLHRAGMHHGHAGGIRHGAGQSHRTGHSHGAAGKTPVLASFFGLGRVPAPLVWGSALLGWGVFGFWGTQLWQGLLHSPAAFVLPALATALAGAIVTEKMTAEAVSHFLPGDENYAVSAVELCGLTGTVAFPVDTGRGRVHVYDPHGTMHDMSARTAPGVGTVARGRRVLVVDYDGASDQLIVEEAL